MNGKIGKKGVHLNPAGRLTFINFLQSKLVKPKQRVFSVNSVRSSDNKFSVETLPTVVTPNKSADPPQIVKPVTPSFTATSDTGTNQQNYRLPIPLDVSYGHPVRQLPPHGPWYTDQHQVRDIAASVANELFKQQQNQQRMFYNNCPPVQPWRGQFY